MNPGPSDFKPQVGSGYCMPYTATSEHTCCSQTVVSIGKEVKMEDRFTNIINSKMNTGLQILIKPTITVEVYSKGTQTIISGIVVLT